MTRTFRPPRSSTSLARRSRLVERAAHASLLATTALALTACGGASPVPPPSAPSAQSAGPRPPPPTPDAVWAQIEPEQPEQRWSLLANDSKVLCTLPCAHWVSPTSGEFLQYDIPGTTHALQVSFPETIGPGGSSVVAIARPGKPSRRAGTSLILGGVALAFAAAISFVFTDARGGGDANSYDVIAAALGGVSLAVIGAGLYVRFKSHPPDVTLRAAAASTAPRATFALGPGFLEAGSSPPSGFHLVLSPLGAAGTF